MRIKLFLITILISRGALAQTQLCDVLPQIIKDSRTAFSKTKMKLLSDRPEEKAYESPYMIDGKAFGTIYENKEQGTYFFSYLNAFKSKQEAEQNLIDIEKQNHCKNGLTWLKRSTPNGERFLELFEGSNSLFAPANLLIQIMENQGQYLLALHAHPTYDRFYEPVTSAADSSGFSKALRHSVKEFHQPGKAHRLKGKERITQRSSPDLTIYESLLQFPNADAYIEEDREVFGTTNLVFHLFADRKLDEGLLETLFKETVSKVNASLGKGYYFQKSPSGDWVTYYTLDKLGYGRTGSVLFVRKNSEQKKVTIEMN